LRQLQTVWLSRWHVFARHSAAGVGGTGGWTRPGWPDGIDLRGVRDNAVTGYRLIEELRG